MANLESKANSSQFLFVASHEVLTLIASFARKTKTNIRILASLTNKKWHDTPRTTQLLYIERAFLSKEGNSPKTHTAPEALTCQSFYGKGIVSVLSQPNPEEAFFIKRIPWLHVSHIHSMIRISSLRMTRLSTSRHPPSLVRPASFHSTRVRFPRFHQHRTIAGTIKIGNASALDRHSSKRPSA